MSKPTQICVALLRGINVGPAKRVPMAELRQLCEQLGWTRVRTLLNSGNVVFEAPTDDVAQLTHDIEQAIERHCHFKVNVVVITAHTLQTAVDQNTLSQATIDPARLLLAFPTHQALLDKVRPLLGQSWHPDAMALGTEAAYLWCESGVIKSPLMQAYSKLAGDQYTARNWSTVLKVLAATQTSRTPEQRS